MSENVQVNKFTSVKYSARAFTMLESFKVEFDDGKTCIVTFNEKKIHQLSLHSLLVYSKLGREFCFVFDIMYAKARTESVAESFYRVGKHSHRRLQKNGIRKPYIPVAKDKRSQAGMRRTFKVVMRL